MKPPTTHFSDATGSTTLVSKKTTRPSVPFRKLIIVLEHGLVGWGISWSFLRIESPTKCEKSLLKVLSEKTFFPTKKIKNDLVGAV